MEAILGRVFETEDFEGGDLDGGLWRGCTFRGCTFEDARFTGCQFEGNGTDIDNRSGQPLDLSQAIFQ